MKQAVLWYICGALLFFCNIIHKLNLEKLEYKLTRKTCNFALLSLAIEEKHNVGYWEPVNSSSSCTKNLRKVEK